MFKRIPVITLFLCLMMGIVLLSCGKAANNRRVTISGAGQ